MPPKTIYLIDGSAFLYRAYYSLPPMTAPDGTPVHVLYGFCRILKKFIDDFNPHHLAIAWDTPSEISDFRQKLYPAYKANRPHPPPELDMQRALVKEFCNLLDICQYEKPGEEADDILYSLALNFEKKEFNVVIVTTDKDLCQAITDFITNYDPFKKRWTDTKSVLVRYGVPVDKLVFYFALIGDPIDNIPGVQGIGPLTARELVNAYPSLDQLYQHIGQIEPKKLREQLIKHEIEARLSEKLFKLKFYNLKIPHTLCSFTAKNWNNAEEFFKKYNFQSLLPKK